MSEKRLLALLGFLLGIVAFAFLLLAALPLGRLDSITAAFLLERFVEVVLAIALLLGSIMIYRGSYAGGGLVNLVVGIVVFIWSGQAWDAALLAVLSGVLGLVANEARR